MTIPINKTGPKNAVTDADNKEEAMIIKYLSRLRLTPMLIAYCFPKAFPIKGFIVLKQMKSPIKTLIPKTVSWLLDN